MHVVNESSISTQELELFQQPVLLRNFAHYMNFSSKPTALSLAKVYNGGSNPVAVVPVVRLHKRMATQVLRPPMRQLLGVLFGPFARKTTLLVDTSFLAYDYRSPFIVRNGSDGATVKKKVIA